MQKLSHLSHCPIHPTEHSRVKGETLKGVDVYNYHVQLYFVSGPHELVDPAGKYAYRMSDP